MGDKKILSRAHHALDNVLEYYTSHGITLPKAPTMRYLPQKFSEDENAIAVINLDENVSKEHKKLKQIGYHKIYWKAAYGIDLSHDAITQFYHASSGERFKRPVEFHTYNEDILLFKPFKSYSKEKHGAEVILAHEVWHLIEQDRGVLGKNPFLVEGTATYAENEYEEEVSDGDDNCYTYEDLNEHILYEEISNLIARNMKNQTEGLKTLFRQKFRDKLERKAYTLIGRKVKENEVFADELKEILGIKPLLKVLRKYSTNCLSTIRDHGAHLFADELEKHDLEALLRK